MNISAIRANINKHTPGMTLRKYVKHILYHGQDCGYIEAAGKKKYVLTPALEKLERKLEMNNFDPNMPRFIDQKEFKMFRHLLKPFIRNEKGISKLKLENNNTLFFSPSPASTIIWDRKGAEPVITIIKRLKSPTTEFFYDWFPWLRKWHRVSPFEY